MDSNTVRGLVNQILYAIDFVPELNDAAAEEHSDRLSTQRVQRVSVEEYVQAIELTLQKGHLPPQTVGMNSRFSEAELLDYLSRLANELARKRP